MYNALYALNVEPDIVPAGDPNLSRYAVLLVPPLYSASDAVLQQVSDYVKNGGHVVMAFKSGFTNEHSTVRHVVAPGPLRAAAGVYYREFTNIPEPRRLAPDPFGAGERNTGSAWAEFLVPETAEVVASFVHPHWDFPAITRNAYGKGTLVYQGTVLSNELQREVIRDVLKRAGLLGPDQILPDEVKVRHARNAAGRRLHYYLNFSDSAQSVRYLYASGTDLLTDGAVRQGAALSLKPWDLAIVVERP
jgi:beta-galactosidase